MNLTLPIFLVGAVTGSVLMVADAPPKFNVEPGCKEAVALDQSIDTDPGVSQNYQSCMNDEASAHEELVQSWSKYSAAEKTRCVGQTEVGGMPSYVEVLECLLVTVNVGNPGSADGKCRQPGPAAAAGRSEKGEAAAKKAATEAITRLRAWSAVRMAFRILISPAPLSVAWAHATPSCFRWTYSKSMEKTCGDASGKCGARRCAR